MPKKEKEIEEVETAAEETLAVENISEPVKEDEPEFNLCRNGGKEVHWYEKDGKYFACTRIGAPVTHFSDWAPIQAYLDGRDSL